MADYIFSNTNIAAQKIKFFSGVQSDLNKYFLGSNDANEGKAIEGAFYLTTDTQRLYIGRDITVNSTTKTIPIPVNQGILTVASVTALPTYNSVDPPHSGEFYYASAENVLCIFNGKTWVQLNPDTNYNDAIEITKSIISEGHSVTGTFVKTTDTAIVNNKDYYEWISNSTTNCFSVVSSATKNDLYKYYEQSTTAGSTLVYGITLEQRKQDLINNATDNTYSNTSITSYLVIPVSDLAAAGNAGIELTSVTNNIATIGLNGSLADTSTNIQIKSGTGITIVAGTTNNDVVISGKSYTFSSTINNATKAQFILKDENNASQIVNFYTSSTSNLALSSVTNSASEVVGIRITHSAPAASIEGVQRTLDTIVKDGKTYYTDAAGQTTATGLTVGSTISGTFYERITSYGVNTGNENAGDVIHIPVIERDRYGHISEIHDNAVTLPSVEGVTISTISASDDGRIHITYAGNTSMSSVSADLYHTITLNGATQSTVVYNQGDLGSFYTKDKIDEMMQGLNAMTYKGTVGQQGDTVQTLPTSGVHNGDVYLASTNTTLNYNGTANAVSLGDLFIASGTETNGVIPNGDVVWTRVESGEKTDTTYTLGVASSTYIALVPSTDSNDLSQKFGVTASSPISASFNSTSKIYTISHKTSGLSDSTTYIGSYSGTTLSSDSSTLNFGGTFKTVNIKADKYGHIQGVGVQTFTLPTETSYWLRNASTTADGAVNDTSIHLLGSNNVHESVDLVGDTSGGVQITASSNSILIQHATVTSTSSASSQSISSTTFAAISGLTVDSFGHLSGYEVKTYTLPSHSLKGNSVSTAVIDGNTYQIASSVLYRGNSSLGTVKYQSTTLDISSNVSSSSTNTTYTIDLKWQSF